MPRYVDRLSIRNLILLALAGPFLAGAIAAMFLMGERVIEYRQLGQMRTLTALTEAMGDLIHEQQKERGATSVFINSEGAQFGPELAKQRQKTDVLTASLVTQLNKLDYSIVSDEIAAHLKTIEAGLGQRSSIREDVDFLVIPLGQALGHYTGLNAAMLETIAGVGTMSKDAGVTTAVNVYTALMAAKERAGIERAVASGGFASGEFPVSKLLTLQRLISQQTMGFDFFRGFANRKQEQELEAINNMPETKEVERMRQIFFAFPRTNSTEGVTAQDFFAASTARIEALKRLEDQLAAEVQVILHDHIRKSMIFFAVIAGAALALFIAIYLMIRLALNSIIKSINTIADSATSMSKGDLDAKLPVDLTADLMPVVHALDRFRKSIRDAQTRETQLAQDQETARRQEEERQKANRRADEERLRAETEANAIKREQEQGFAQEISAVVAACAEGDFTRRLDLTGKDGVFADICAGVNKIGEVVDSGLGEVHTSLQRLAAGDMTYRMPQDQQGIFSEIARSMNETTQTLESSLSRVLASSATVGGSTQEISNATEDLARRSERNAAMLEETAAALQEMSESVTKAADSANHARSSVSAVTQTAENSNHIVQGTMDAMEEISEASASIERVLGVIDEIAFQTNLLALNAGVEAARAGDAGRGFAVVASEVRALAQRSSDSAREIAEMISKSSDSVRRGVDMVNQSGAVLNEIVDAIRGVSGAIEGIAVTFGETKLGIQEITTATTELDKITQQNTQMFDETNTSIRALDKEAAELATEMAAFKLDGVPQSETDSAASFRAA